MSRGWLFTISACFLIPSAIGITGEAVLLANGFWIWRGLNGTRLGLTCVCLLTGLFAAIAMAKQNRKLIFLTMILAIASLVVTSFMCGEYTLRRLEDYTDRLVMSREAWVNPWGRMYFPFLPWTPLLVMTASVAPFLLALSLVTMFTCFDLLVSKFFLQPHSRKIIFSVKTYQYVIGWN